MTPLQLRPSTLDEIIFEGRNKAYGAFDLRQHYPEHLRRAMAIAVTLFAVMAAAPIATKLLWPDKPVAPPTELPDIDFTKEPTVFHPIDKTKPEVAPPPAAHVKTPPTVALPTHITPDEQVRVQPVTPVIPQDALFGPIDSPGDSGAVVSNDGQGHAPGAGVPGGTGTETNTTPAKPEVFISVEHMPEFTGGPEAMLKFLQKNMRYPSLALRNQIEGKVFVAFTVSASGEIIDVEVLKGLGYGTDEEAARVVKLMPRWQPGAQNGRNVAVRYTLPIPFTVR
jgi:periplasmic protein TonB